jgi:hypothetical protein
MSHASFIVCASRPGLQGDLSQNIKKVDNLYKKRIFWKIDAEVDSSLVGLPDFKSGVGR